MELNFIELLVILIAITVGGLIHGTLGIGFPLVATPVIALVTDVRTAIIILLIPTMAVNIASILSGGRFMDVVKKFWFILVFIGIGSYIGTSMLVLLDPNPFRLLLALVILFYLYTRNTSLLSWAFVREYPHLTGAGVGSVAGLLAGTVNITMPPLIIYFTEMRLQPLQIIQILNVCFFIGKITQMGTFIARDAIELQTILLSIPFSIIAIVILGYGINIRNRIDAGTYRRWLMTALKVIAIVLVVQFILRM
jgi:uncharacterized protein